MPTMLEKLLLQRRLQHLCLFRWLHALLLQVRCGSLHDFLVLGLSSLE